MLAIFSSQNAYATEQSQALTWGYVNFAPYHYNDKGNVTGFIADHIKSIFKDSNLSFSAVELPNKRTKLYIENGKVDFSTVIESFISNPSDFLKSDLPVYHIILGAVCLKDTHEIKHIDDLKKTRLILLSGYTYGTDKQLDEKNGFNIELSAQNHDSAILALKYKRADCVLGYKSPTDVEKEKHPNLNLTFYKINEFPVYLFLNKKVVNATVIMDTINQHISPTHSPLAQ
ncbi:substrate-binding periplasmic protein [Pseudoalteromonas sp. H105]|uniref:substrate-binding periplasmic protein n=1 Tax=Pseudoalteromonas sp. H105 TaxID=1348393 RepID=UPI00073220CF|nr:transporter substrate-binding domain-containing protein [Pseudoalteromonas sp. H105]KTF17907.1 hypothetical protein ATS75_00340 [Pseudoalteromonas sp. H105]